MATLERWRSQALAELKPILVAGLTESWLAGTGSTIADLAVASNVVHLG